MADFEILSGTISRDELSLPDLEINDHLNYILNDELLGGTNTWNRQTTRSPYVDGEYTVNKTLGEVEERIAIEVLGGSSLELQSNVAQLVRAISQNKFMLTIYVDDSVWAYDCETADYTVGWEKTRRMVYRSTVSLMVRRHPKLVAGGY